MPTDTDTTTEFGSWLQFGDHRNALVESSVAECTDGEDGLDAVAHTTITAAYREAINVALPPGVSLAGNTFYGPAIVLPNAWALYPTDPETGALDIKAIIDSVDLWDIVAAHDLYEPTHTLTIVRGEQPGSNGEIMPTETWVAVGPECQKWMTDNGLRSTDPNVWVLVTPYDEQPNAINVIARRSVRLVTP